MISLEISRYLLESSCCLLIFYLFYYYFLRKETFFQLNRTYLLTTPFLSLIIPLLNFSFPESTAEQELELFSVPLISFQAAEQVFWEQMEYTSHSRMISLSDLIFILYLVGVLFMAFRLIQGLRRLLGYIRNSKPRKIDGVVVLHSKEKLPASSFFSYIFWNEEKLEGDHKLIFEHELVHIRQRHSLDVLLMEFWVILKWFNPLIYFYRKSLQVTHEYIADQYVVQHRTSVYRYASLLARHHQFQEADPLVNTFYSSTKKRLIMLATRPSKKWKQMKYFAALPLFGLLFSLFSFDMIEELPGSVSDNLTQAEQYLDELGETPVWEAGKTTTEYILQWGDTKCKCFADQFDNFFHCESQSYTPGEFKRLAKKTDGFKLIKEGQVVPIRNIHVQTNRSFKMNDYQSQYEEMPQFDQKLPFWNQVKKGDNLKFVFSANEKDLFKFDVTINNRKAHYDYAYEVALGDYRYSVDLHSSFKEEVGVGWKHLSIADFNKALQQPLKAYKKGGEQLMITSVKVRNGLAMYETKIEDHNRNQVDISQFPGIMHAQPGDRISINLGVEDGKSLKLSMKIKESDDFQGLTRSVRLKWGDLIFTDTKDFNMINLPTTTIHRLAGQPMELTIDGEKFKILEIELTQLFSRDFAPEKITCEAIDYDKDRSCLENMFKKMKHGSGLMAHNIHAEGNHTFSLSIFAKDEGGTGIGKVEYLSPEDEKSGAPSLMLFSKTQVEMKKTEEFLNQDPLIILDGKWITEKDSKAFLDNIDPESIEKIEVLKGESAIEKYGPEAKNGVIVITTKGL